jgi:predicted TIM-barrel fold metal-dependent hydrolase
MAASALPPIVDANVHLWDQSVNPVFWLSDRTTLRDMLGDYDSLPDRYTLADYLEEVEGFDVRAVVWSDPGAHDPVAAAEAAGRQGGDHDSIAGLVGLGDPTAPGFAALVERLLRVPGLTSVRVRLAAGLATPATAPDDASVLEGLRLLARHDLVATIEANADQLGRVADLVEQLPEARIVVDHFGWPATTDAASVAPHLERLAPIAAAPNVATRLDAIGTIFGDWTVDDVRPWLVGVVDLFGADRCMLGSDLPIERLRSDFAALCAAYDEIFAGRSDDERAALFGQTALQWYGSGGR